MDGTIRYINFSGYYDKFDDWKEKPRQLQDTRVYLSTKQNSGGFPVKNMQKMMKINWRYLKEIPRLGIS